MTSNNITTTTQDNTNHDDYSMPAEWEPHDACLMLYPHATFTFRLPQAQREFLGLAHAVATQGQEHVVLFCSTLDIARQVQLEMTQKSTTQTAVCKVITRVCPSDDSWARDMGPTFVVSTTHNSRRVVGLDWDFNAWGGPDEGCYWPCEQDRLAAKCMCAALNDATTTSSSTSSSSQDDPHRLPLSAPLQLTARKIPIVLEGGSIHVDGEGTILTTRECLLNKNRNPTKSQSEIEDILKRHLLHPHKPQKILWLPYGVDGDDDTNGHIDNFACFAKPGEIILSWTDDHPKDKVNYERCRQALTLLKEQTDAQGRTLVVHKLPLPPPMYYTQEEVDGLDLYHGEPARHVGERMAASYVNFYVANKAVMVPQFGCCPEADETALQVLRTIFEPERAVVGVPSKEILLGGGNIHCITQQLPKSVL